MTTADAFTEPYNIGNTFGPGRATVSCLACGSVVLPEHRDLHLTKCTAALPLHRTEAGYPNCMTCDGGGCPDCTDPA